MCHGFGDTSGGGSNIVAVDGTRQLRYINCCKLSDNRIVMCCYSPDAPSSGLAYAITLEDPIFPLRPTVGAACTFHLGLAYNSNCVAIDETHFIVAYEDISDGSKGKTIYCTVDWSGRTINFSYVETFSSNNIGGGFYYGIGMASNSNSVIALSYRDQSDNNYVKTITSISITPPVPMPTKALSAVSKTEKLGIEGEEGSEITSITNLEIEAGKNGQSISRT
jgi:hypothetical protein